MVVVCGTDEGRMRKKEKDTDIEPVLVPNPFCSFKTTDYHGFILTLLKRIDVVEGKTF